MFKKNGGFVYLMYGPPASGKTTLASFLSGSLKADYISLGEIVRREISRGTDLGLNFKKYLDEVMEYPPELIETAVKNELASYHNERPVFIFDGLPKYPREVPFFVKLLKEENLKLKDIIVIDLPLDVAMKRTDRRKICSDCLKQQNTGESGEVCGLCGGQLVSREDDADFFFKRRYNDYSVSVNEVLGKIGSLAEKIIHINGDQPEESVKKDIGEKVKLNMPE